MDDRLKECQKRIRLGENGTEILHEKRKKLTLFNDVNQTKQNNVNQTKKK